MAVRLFLLRVENWDYLLAADWRARARAGSLRRSSPCLVRFRLSGFQGLLESVEVDPLPTAPLPELGSKRCGASATCGVIHSSMVIGSAFAARRTLEPSGSKARGTPLTSLKVF